MFSRFKLPMLGVAVAFALLVGALAGAAVAQVGVWSKPGDPVINLQDADAALKVWLDTGDSIAATYDPADLAEANDRIWKTLGQMADDLLVSVTPASPLTLRVVADPTALSFSAYTDGGTLDGLPGPFYIPGEIFDPVTGTKIGTFHCWGFFFNADQSLAVVSQEFDLTGRGKIMVQGVEDEGPRAVTGGTGEFRNLRGEMTGADLSAFPDFTVTFALIGG